MPPTLEKLKGHIAFGLSVFACVRPSQWGTLIFSYTRRLGSVFGVQNFEFQYFWGFQKNEYFWGYEDSVNIFWGHHKIGLYFGVISILDPINTDWSLTYR